VRDHQCADLSDAGAGTVLGAALQPAGRQSCDSPAAPAGTYRRRRTSIAVDAAASLDKDNRTCRGCQVRAWLCVLRVRTRGWGRKEQSSCLSLAVTTRSLSCQLLFPPCTAKITEGGGTLGRGKSESSHVHTLLVITQQSRKARKQTAIREPHGCEDARGNIYSWSLIRAIRHEACPTPSPPACRPSRTPHAHAHAARPSSDAEL
jgi:hypothetical protein